MTPVELVCFHHADGGSASFHPLRRALAAKGDAAACVRGLADELDDLLSRPHILLGHSMGALLAYSLTQQLISRGLTRSWSPQLPALSRTWHRKGS